MKTNLRHKAALAGAAILAGLILLTVACEQPTSTTQTKINTTPKLANPSNLKVTAVNGAFIVSWDQVLDADSYELWRRDVETGHLTRIGGQLNAGEGYTYVYVDRAGYNNQIVDGKSYRYVVYAFNAAFRNTTTDISAEARSDSRAESGSVRAILPADYTLFLPEDADIKANLVTDNGADFLEVWFLLPNLDNAAVNYKFEYGYTLGEAEFGYATPANNIITDNNGLYRRARFPLLGGTPQVKVTAYWNTASGFLPPVSKFITPEVARAVLGNVDVNNIVSTPIGANALKLTWNAVDGADGYDVYRAEVKDGIIDAAVAITETQQKNVTTFSLIDRGYDGTKDYYYYIIAKQGETARSANAAEEYVAGGFGAFDAVTISNVDVFYPLPFNSPLQVKFNWAAEEGVTYKVYRAPIAWDWVLDEFKSFEGDYVDVTVNSSRSDGTVNYLDIVGDAATNLKYRQAYHYKVESTRTADGAIAETGMDKGILNAEPFSTYLAGDPGLETPFVGYYKIGIQPPDRPHYDSDVTFDIEVATYDATGALEPWRSVVTGLTPGAIHTYTVRDADLFKRHVFTQVAKSGTKILTVETSTVTEFADRPNLNNLTGFAVNDGNANDDGPGLLTLSLNGLSDEVRAAREALINGIKIYRSTEDDFSDIDRTSAVPLSLEYYTGAGRTLQGVTIAQYTYYLELDKGSLAEDGDTETYYLGVEADGYTDGNNNNDGKYATIEMFDTYTVTRGTGESDLTITP